MPANVGKMFYFGKVPWHREGVSVGAPLTVAQALAMGELDWKVGEVEIQTAENPPSPAMQRKALVRLDRPAGHDERVLGIVHQGYDPLQNRDGAELFDAIFGKSEPVYHTGGYLGHGERIWLLAKIDQIIEVASGDTVQPYALYSNSHGGPDAVSICLTTVRVVCQNTLNLALRDASVGQHFRRAHRGTALQHAEAAQAFWASALTQCNQTRDTFQGLAGKPCSDAQFDDLVAKLLPLPPAPKAIGRRTKEEERAARRYEQIIGKREEIHRLRNEGKGANLDSARGTFWGALNAITEFVDHGVNAGSIKTLLGDGMRFKQKAYNLVLEMSRPPL